MPLDLSAGPATEPLTLAEVRTHLLLDSTNAEPAPTEPTVALVSPAAAGNVDNGAHRYRVTFVTADGETEGGTVSAIVTVADKAVNGKVAVSAIPLGGSAVTSRKLYRTIAAGATYLLLATIADNTTTTYTDNIADGSLGAGAPTTNTTNDPYLTSLVKSARRLVESETGRALITQTWILRLEGFPTSSDCPLWVPLPPLQSVSSIAYVDADGVSQTWAAASYQVTTPAGDAPDCGRIAPAYGEVWPTTREQMEAVTITFVAGYGAAGAVPEDLKHAMKLIVGHLYEQRQLVVVGASVTQIPKTTDWIVDLYRVRREPRFN